MVDKKDQLVGEDKMRDKAVIPPEPESAQDKPDSDQEREDEELEEGLEETFPASDPPANIQPGHDRPVPSSGAPEKSEKDA